MGVWIEIKKMVDDFLNDGVTPFMGVWIEIFAALMISARL